MEQTATPTIIEKEAVATLRFPLDEVLTSTDDIKLRRFFLERATSLGNMEHGKMRILFQDEEGLKQINTTIWATTENSIILKKGVTIPINRIVRVF